MDPWKRFRLLAFTGVMLTMFGMGACASFLCRDNTLSEEETAARWSSWHRSANPFVRLQIYDSMARFSRFSRRRPIFIPPTPQPGRFSGRP